MWRGEEKVLFLPSGINVLFCAHTVTFKSKYLLYQAHIEHSLHKANNTNTHKQLVPIH